MQARSKTQRTDEQLQAVKSYENIINFLGDSYPTALELSKKLGLTYGATLHIINKYNLHPFIKSETNSSYMEDELYNYIKECRRINSAYFARKKRLKDRVNDLLHRGTCIFVTLTFNDETMAKYNEKQRRVLVSRFLKRCSDKYVANIDYGNDDKYSHREHYHALVLSDYISETWEGGFSWFEKIHRIDSDVCLAKYICKLCNHAIKESTKRACYIYSR